MAGGVRRSGGRRAAPQARTMPTAAVPHIVRCATMASAAPARPTTNVRPRPAPRAAVLQHRHVRERGQAHRERRPLTGAGTLRGDRAVVQRDPHDDLHLRPPRLDTHLDTAARAREVEAHALGVRERARARDRGLDRGAAVIGRRSTCSDPEMMRDTSSRSSMSRVCSLALRSITSNALSTPAASNFPRRTSAAYRAPRPGRPGGSRGTGRTRRTDGRGRRAGAAGSPGTGGACAHHGPAPLPSPPTRSRSRSTATWMTRRPTTTIRR